MRRDYPRNKINIALLSQLPLLLIADTSVPEALGKTLVRGSEAHGLKVGSDLCVTYSSQLFSSKAFAFYAET